MPDDELLSKAEELVTGGEIEEAQKLLNSAEEKSARWHFVQSGIFYIKGWPNESKKQLEIAIEQDPENEEYKKVYNDLLGKIEQGFLKESEESKEKNKKEKRRQMGEACGDACGEGLCMCCCEGICEGICDGL